jgi:hypothetical protein
MSQKTPLTQQIESVAFCGRVLARVLPSLVGQALLTEDEAAQLKQGIDGAYITLTWADRNAETIRRTHACLPR